MHEDIKKLISRANHVVQLVGNQYRIYVANAIKYTVIYDPIEQCVYIDYRKSKTTGKKRKVRFYPDDTEYTLVLLTIDAYLGTNLGRR